MPNPKSSAPATHTSTTEKRELSANNFIAISTVILIIAVVLTGLFVKGQWPSIKLNNKVIDKKSAANKQLDKNLEAIPKLLARVNSLGPQSQLILDALPVKADFPTIIGASEVMATASGVKLNGVNSTETAVTTTNNPNAAPPTTAAVPADQPQPFRYSVDVTGVTLASSAIFIIWRFRPAQPGWSV